ncbi:hypothetical protein D1AOALGA4SA_4866 [Olavius algarvensis Delta 1 endosymbiont]|nr:hypothetical protein D1AOALGA4SA_4866 [Olavius algarvensis Delta 1 endosymbiont]
MIKFNTRCQRCLWPRASSLIIEKKLMNVEHRTSNIEHRIMYFINFKRLSEAILSFVIRYSTFVISCSFIRGVRRQ